MVQANTMFDTFVKKQVFVFLLFWFILYMLIPTAIVELIGYAMIITFVIQLSLYDIIMKHNWKK